MLSFRINKFNVIILATALTATSGTTIAAEPKPDPITEAFVQMHADKIDHLVTEIEAPAAEVEKAATEIAKMDDELAGNLEDEMLPVRTEKQELIKSAQAKIEAVVVKVEDEKRCIAAKDLYSR